MAKKIIISGMMNAGKTAITNILNKEYNYKTISLDEFIQKKEKQEINDILKTKNEDYFRKIERKYLKELLKSDKYQIIDLGGGAIVNYDLFKDNIIIFIDGKFNDESKPLFKDYDKLWKQRKPLYLNNYNYLIENKNNKTSAIKINNIIKKEGI